MDNQDSNTTYDHEENLIQQNVDLRQYTTFKVEAKARLFAEYKNVRELIKITRTQAFLNNEVIHIGEGSNLLFCGDYSGLVLKSGIKGIKKYQKDEETVYVIAGAAEKWIDVVNFCLDNDLAGLENLAGIPGEAGASAVQNVGAYGVEAGGLIHSVECFDIMTRREVTFKGEECGFAYRDSKFKREWKGRYYVLRVSYKLKASNLADHLDYGPLKTLESSLGHKPTIQEVAATVIKTRDSKLPDPKEIGSAGSFFKNPIVNEFFFKEEVLPYHPDLPWYPAEEGHVKLAAGWMIEHSGLKGFSIGGAEVYPKQCLVIANRGNASWQDVMAVCSEVKSRVKKIFKVDLQPEVNIIDLNIKVTVLGSGTSKGIPEIGCKCKVCTSEDQHDKRTRASILVEVNGLKIMIDASPDFRYQALRENIDDLDAILVTHSHYDHVGGLDDIRPLCINGNIPIYVSKDVDGDLRKRLDYCFKEHPYPGVPNLDLHIIDSRPFYLQGLKIIPIRVFHGKLPIFGYRIGDFAYITDCKTIDEDELDKLKGVRVLIINALREREHFAHLSIPEAVELINKIHPDKAYLTHLCHDAPTHKELDALLQDNIHPAYDGMKIEVN